MENTSTDAKVESMDSTISSVVEGSGQPDPAVGIVSTVDDVPVKAVDTGDAVAEAAKTAAAKAAKKDGDETRFDQHPRFQQLMQEREDARIEAAALKARLETLTPKETKPEKLPFKDITKMAKEEVAEWMLDDPIGYAANLSAQIKWEQNQEFQRERNLERQTESVKSTYQQYEKDNADFRKMWDSGEIQKFMDSHPGHNAISAHMALTTQAKVDAAVQKAVKEAEERVTKNFAAKRSAQVISEGADTVRTAKTDMPPEIKDTKQHGGLTAVLASRLRAMRQAV